MWGLSETIIYTNLYTPETLQDVHTYNTATYRCFPIYATGVYTVLDCMNRVPNFYKLIIPLLLLYVKIVCAYMHMYTRIGQYIHVNCTLFE